MVGVAKVKQYMDSIATDYNLNNAGIRIQYIPEGTFYLRFYQDSEGHPIRAGRRHLKTLQEKDERGFNLKVHLPCLVGTPAGCVVCDYVNKKFEQFPGFTPKWDYQAKDYCLTYVKIFSFEGPENEALKQNLNIPIVMMAHKRFLKAFYDTVAGLPHDEIEKMFSLESHVLWEIKNKGAGGNEKFEFKISNRQHEPLEPLDVSAPPLSEILYRENEIPSSDQVNAFIKVFDVALSMYNRAMEPSPTMHEPPPVSYSNPQAKARQAASVTPVSAAGSVVSAVKTSNFKKECFGTYKTDVDCIMCDEGKDCEAATAA